MVTSWPVDFLLPFVTLTITRFTFSVKGKYLIAFSMKCQVGGEQVKSLLEILPPFNKLHRPLKVRRRVENDKPWRRQLHLEKDRLISVN